MNLWTENIDHYILQEPPEFDTEGAAKAGEIGCFNCAHKRGEAKSGEIVCDRDGIELEEPDLLHWSDIMECWECE